MVRSGWFSRKPTGDKSSTNIPAGIVTKCLRCNEILFVKDFERNAKVCTKCGFHHKLSAYERIEITVDEGSFQPLNEHILSKDPLHFPEYPAKLEKAQTNTRLSEAIITGTAFIDNRPVVIGVSDFGYMGGSMGSVVGERISRAMEYGLAHRLPVILFTASGGARMQEGLLSLMQMAKTSASAGKLREEGVLFICVLTDPTTGGVYASYASLGDIILAEPGAIVGFAGRRVGNQDAGVNLPDNFQTSEFQAEHGMVDRILPRKEIRPAIALLLKLFDGRRHNDR